MRRLSVLILGAILSFAFLFCGCNVLLVAAEENSVYIGGMSAGFTLNTGSVQVIGICEVVTEKGVSSPALEAGLRAGDNICKINETPIKTVGQLNEIINKSNGKSLILTFKRKQELSSIEVCPIFDKLSRKYRIGVLVRDNVSGIGTVTYIDKKSGKFGALGHAVTSDNQENMQISNGLVYPCNIIGVSKGLRGRAGELKGVFISEQTFGVADKLCECGIFGKISKEFNTEGLNTAVASSKEAKPGRAYIYSTINGIEAKRYEIEIVKVDKEQRENKNYVIHIIDERLISETGGIVQGMSGSPILQGNKLIGAVTHVFLNDPTRGYGIDIETMLQQ